MKKWRLLWTVVKRSSADKIVYSFVINFFIVALLITLVEPTIHKYSNGIWYTFVSCSTIGFGDITVTTLWGRLLTAYIAIAEIMTVAVISGVVVSYYLEVIHRREQETVTLFLDKLEHLQELTPEELSALSKKIKEQK
ncbi:MAG: potassium channel family protein [Peptococcaceae bacterium]|nr:potassium channel family protein [Peptococcaceae bacterium]